MFEKGKDTLGNLLLKIQTIIFVLFLFYLHISINQSKGRNQNLLFLGKEGDTGLTHTVTQNLKNVFILVGFKIFTET